MRTPRFEIFEGKNNEFFFRLKAKNGKIILSSEGYTQKHNAEKGIEAVLNAIDFEATTEMMFPNVFQIREDMVAHLAYHSELVNSYSFWFVVKSINSEIIGRSETYTSKSSARKGIASVQRCAPIAEIVDLTGEI